MDLADACQWADELFACHWAQQVEAEWAEAEHWAKDLADDFERSEVQTFARQVGLPKALKDEWRGDGPPKKPVTPGPLTGSKRQRFEQITGCKRRRGGSKYHQKLLARLQDDNGDGNYDNSGAGSSWDNYGNSDGSSWDNYDNSGAGSSWDN